MASEWTDSQISEMCNFRLLDGAGVRSLLPNVAVQEAYRDWVQTLCKHEFERVLRRKQIKGPTPQIVKICQECAFKFGGPVSHKDAPPLNTIPWLSNYNHETYLEQRAAVWRAKQNELYQNYDNRKILGDFSYPEYLKSDTWKARRAKVLARASNICEGCGKAKAEHVHHLRYAHIGNEFLWELVAICQACHDRVHPEKHNVDRFDD